MFFNLVYRNAKRSRQENLIYFATLVTAVASFYMILSLERQDVILYLKDFESDAVARLFSLMPILYFIALFLLFFLVLFANRYQVDRRSKEFGMYLMLGMKQQRLFFLLIAEGILTSIVALGSGILIGGILAEVLSLTTARLIGQGIITHQLSFSFEAALYTAAGFLLIQLVALLLLAGQLFRQELHALLRGQIDKKQAMGNVQGNWLTLLLGVAVLGIAYWLVIRYFWIVNYPMIFLAVILGTIGTILVIRGVARILNVRALYSNRSNGLATFTVRQLQENITNRSTAIAVSSILMMLSLIMLAEGASTIMSSSEQLQRENSIYDFTVQGEAEAVTTFLTSEKMMPYVEHLNPMELGIAADELSFDWSPLREKIVEYLPEGVEDPAIENPEFINIDEQQSDAENLLGTLDERINGYFYFIRESSYNRLLEAAGEEKIDLGEGEVALYLNTDFIKSDSPTLKQILMEAQLDQETLLSIEGAPLSILPELPIKSLVTDRSITIVTAFVVPDNLFEASVPPIRREIYWNFKIPANITEEAGLMMPMKAASDLLSTTEFQFESYLQNFGRHLFYIIAGSYTMLYLAFLFLIIGCTVLALQFLTQLKQTKRRYQTLTFLGSNRDQINHSIRKQILWYFLFPLIPALVSGSVGVIAMKTYIRFNADFLPSIGKMLPFVLLMVGLFLLVQWIYATAAYRTAIKEVEQQTFK